jgi:hypothetical protein
MMVVATVNLEWPTFLFNGFAGLGWLFSVSGTSTGTLLMATKYDVSFQGNIIPVGAIKLVAGGWHCHEKQLCDVRKGLCNCQTLATKPQLPAVLQNDLSDGDTHEHCQKARVPHFRDVPKAGVLFDAADVVVSQVLTASWHSTPAASHCLCRRCCSASLCPLRFCWYWSP